MSMIINPYRYAVSGGIDPYWAQVKSLINFVGASGSTTIVDEKGVAWTAQGNAQISTSNPPPGCTSSLILDGSADWIQTTGISSFSFPGDFTFEGFARLSTIKSTVLFDNYGASGGFQVYLASGTGFSFYIGTSGALINVASVIPAVNTWFHWAVSRSGSTIRAFINGSLIGNASSASAISPTASPVSYGAQVASRNGTYDMAGQIGPSRVTAAARYTASFTPPTGLFPTS